MKVRESEFMQLPRREFLRLGGLSSAALVFGFSLTFPDAAAEIRFNPNLFIAVKKDGTVVLRCHRSEMGQGIRTSIAMLLAEELDVSLSDVTLEQADGDERYGDQNTDGSRSIRDNWDRLRNLAASVRMMFVNAAAKKWGVAPRLCQASLGQVSGPGRKSIPYKDLLDMMSSLKIPGNPVLKSPSEFRYIGKAVGSLDCDSHIRGQAEFGMDVRLEGMQYAALSRSPLPSQKLLSFDDSRTRKMAGVLSVFSIEGLEQPANTDAAVVVVAENTWAAFRGVELLKTTWDPNFPGAKDSSAAYFGRLQEALKNLQGSRVYRHDRGKTQPEASRVELIFKTNFLVHAPMEPLVATARVSSGGCEIWAPTQDPQKVKALAADYLGIEPSKVRVHVTFLGGGFGRKAQSDFALEAVVVAKKTGRPVKVVWSREDEIRHGFYQPAALQKLVVGLDKNRLPVGWFHHVASSTMTSVFSKGASELAEWEMGLGATTVPYAIPEVRVLGTHVENPLRRGWLRSVNNICHAFAINSMVDELALRAGQDPVDYSLKLLGNPKRRLKNQHISRLKDVIVQVRQFSDWDKKNKSGRLMGFAHHWSFGSYIAYVVEVEKSGSTFVPVQVHCVLDCGQYVNASPVLNQIDGSVAFGLSVAKYGKVTFENGQVSQSNFHDHPVIRSHEMPEVATRLMVNAHPPQGVGEPGVPPFIPALTNAISRARGSRITELPLVDQGV